MKNKKIYAIFFIGVLCSCYSFSMHHTWSYRPWIEIAKHGGIKDKDDFFDRDTNCCLFIISSMKRLYFTLEDMYDYCTGRMGHDESFVQNVPISPHELENTFVYLKEKRKMMQNIAVNESDVFDENTVGIVEPLSSSDTDDKDDDMQGDTSYNRGIEEVMSIFESDSSKSSSSASRSLKTSNLKAMSNNVQHDASRNTKTQEYEISSSESSSLNSSTRSSKSSNLKDMVISSDSSDSMSSSGSSRSSSPKDIPHDMHSNIKRDAIVKKIMLSFNRESVSPAGSSRSLSPKEMFQSCLDFEKEGSFFKQNVSKDGTKTKSVKVKKCKHCGNEKCDCHKSDFSEHNIIHIGSNSGTFKTKKSVTEGPLLPIGDL